MKYQVVLFDFDGVSYTGTWFSKRLAEEFGTSYEDMQPFFKGVFKQCSLGQADLKQKLPAVLEAWKWPGTVDALIDYWFAEDAIDEPIMHCIETLKANGTHCFIATNQEKYRAASLREKFGQGKIFDDILSSADLGATKNNPAFWETVFNRIGELAGHDKSKIVLIDDDEENVLTARAFGIDAIHYRGPEDLRGLDG